MKITAHVPCQQYGFFEVEGDENDLKKIEKLYNKYAEHPLSFEEGIWKDIVTFTGETVQYNEKTHKYRSEDGTILVSGSQFAKKLEKPFDAAMIAGKVGAKHGVSPEEVASCWSDNGKLSRMFG